MAAVKPARPGGAGLGRITLSPAISDDVEVHHPEHRTAPVTRPAALVLLAPAPGMLLASRPCAPGTRWRRA